MSPLRKILAGRLLSFWREDRSGSVSVETVMVLPILTWWYVASFVFFDGYKAYNRSVKAAYTVSDMLSRQTDAVNDTYLENLSDVYDYMTLATHPSWLRVSQIRWKASKNKYKVDWSFGTDGNNDDRLRNSDMAGIAERLPPLVNGERILLVESFTSFTPVFAVGLSPQITFENFVVTSPRFAPQLAKD